MQTQIQWHREYLSQLKTLRRTVRWIIQIYVWLGLGLVGLDFRGWSTCDHSVTFAMCWNVSCFVKQSGEHFRNSCNRTSVRHHKQNAAVHTVPFRFRRTKTLVTSVCIGAVSGLYYTSLDRQSRRKIRATADGVLRFIRYWHYSSRLFCLLAGFPLVPNVKLALLRISVGKSLEVCWIRIFMCWIPS